MIFHAWSVLHLWGNTRRSVGPFLTISDPTFEPLWQNLSEERVVWSRAGVDSWVRWPPAKHGICMHLLVWNYVLHEFEQLSLHRNKPPRDRRFWSWFVLPMVFVFLSAAFESHQTTKGWSHLWKEQKRQLQSSEPLHWFMKTQSFRAPPQECQDENTEDHNEERYLPSQVYCCCAITEALLKTFKSKQAWNILSC